MLPFSSPKAEKTEDSLKSSPCPQRKNLGTSPAFTIGFMAGDGKTKGTQDRMVPCTVAQHQFDMANIMNRLVLQRRLDALLRVRCRLQRLPYWLKMYIYEESGRALTAPI